MKRSPEEESHSSFEGRWCRGVIYRIYFLQSIKKIVRILQNDFGVPPGRMTAAGRSFYVPIADNETSEGRAKNRRTRIVVLPKLDQFYDLIEQGMKAASN